MDTQKFKEELQKMRSNEYKEIEKQIKKVFQSYYLYKKPNHHMSETNAIIKEANKHADDVIAYIDNLHDILEMLLEERT